MSTHLFSVDKRTRGAAETQVGGCHCWGLLFTWFPRGLAWILHLVSFSFETSFKFDVTYCANRVAKVTAYCLPAFPILLHIGVLGPHP